MTSQGPATDRRSYVEEVEFGPSDHSSALQLLSLGKPRPPKQQPQPPQKQEDADSPFQTKPPSVPSSVPSMPMRDMEEQLRHNSPLATHGRHRKRRRMLEAEAAASTYLKEHQNMAPAKNEMSASNGDNDDQINSSRKEAAIALSGFGAIKTSKDSDQGSASFSPSPESLAKVSVIRDRKKITSDIAAIEEAGASHLERKKSTTTVSSKSLGQRRTGSRRQTALPLNRQKMLEMEDDVQEQIFKSTRQPKKSSIGKSSDTSKSSFHQASTTTIQYVDNPTEKDILLGMRKFNSHPGNEVYRDTVRKFQPNVKTKEKSEVAREIVDHIYNVIGGRFLKVDNHNRWFVMPHIDVMTKVGKAIVELRNKACPVKKFSKSVESLGVLESPKEGEVQASTGRPKRKASLGRKVNNFANETLPSVNQKKKKPKPLLSQNKTMQADATPINRSLINKIVESEPTYEEYVYKADPHEYYVEETAHIYHNPPFPSQWTNGVTIEDLRPIPPPPPLPSFPISDSCKWSFDENSRVLIADFSVGKNGEQPLITLEDSKFLLEMHERTDITVISRGLLNMSKVDSSMWSLGYLRECVGREFYHKFRRFDKIVDKEGMETTIEKDNLFSMRFEDYVDYCEKRESYMKERNGNIAVSSTEEEPIFSFEDHLGKSHSLSVGTSALYMIDVDMKRLTPLLNRNFLESFELPAVLPGGSHCMMNSVTPDARPFMGPNLYVTPPASFTHFHQDGHGTVDSGHLCISGFNEVVMLRRLTERHKKHALWILSGKKPGGFHFDGLYSMPHGDGLGEKPSWPNTERIEECRKMGYCPSVFTLEPGDLVHINKGRLHAFRKMSTSKLPESDCHAECRKNLVESKGIAGEEKLCVSVAWDWMYRGVTPAGINREVCTVLEGSALNRRNEVTSLAIPELSLLQMAKAVPARSLTSSRGISFLGALEKKERKRSLYESTKEEICRGIYPGLCIVVGQHIRALNVEESKSTGKGERLSIAKIPDTQENPQTCPLDPYGDSDFACKLCRKELSNVYFHCDGCEKLLSKDFNICRGCYLQGKFNIKVQMHPSNPKRHATLNHMGDNKFSRQSRCPCKNGPACNYCGFCLGCSCRCHTWFTMRTRLCNAVDEEKLLKSVKDTASVQTAPKLPKTEGAQTSSVFEMEESTKHLRDRLKDAGDDELLNEDKKAETEVKEGDGEKSANDNEEKVKANQGDDQRLPSSSDQDNTTSNEDDKEKLQDPDKKVHDVAIDDNVHEAKNSVHSYASIEDGVVLI